MMESQNITQKSQGGTVMEYSEDRQFDPIPPEPEAAPAPEHTEEAPAEKPKRKRTTKAKAE